MEVRPGYKQSEVGVIPEDWDVTVVGKEFTIQLGKMLDSEKNYGMPKPYVGNRAIQWKQIDLDSIGEIKLTSSDLQRFRLQEGDLLVCEGGEIGRAAIWNSPIEECYYQKALHRLRPIRGYNVQLMLNILQMFASNGSLINFVTQTSIAHLPKDKFEKLPIPVPSTLAEQEAIAEALSDADALIESLEQLTAKKRQIKQGAMQELLTGKRRLPEFNGEWNITSLGQILSRLTNGTVYRASNSFGVPVTRIETISNGFIDFSKTGIAELTDELANYKMISGDILFSHINSLDHIGKVAQFFGEQDLYHGMNLILLRVNKEAISRFLYYWFCSPQTREKARRAAKQAVSQASINTTEMKLWSIFLPSVPEQTAIANILSEMDAEIASLEAKLEKARQVKQGMMQELLTGRIRLV